MFKQYLDIIRNRKDLFVDLVDSDTTAFRKHPKEERMNKHTAW
jgi:hypothetical protein